MSAPKSEATSEDEFVRPKAVAEKLYSGAERICTSVMGIPTSQETQVVKRRVAHSTAGDTSIMNGRNIVLRKETRFT